MIHVNYNQCIKVADWIAKHEIPKNEEEVKVTFDMTVEEIANFYLYVIAICHQTTPLIGEPYMGEVDGTQRRGWDYLTAKLKNAVEAGHNAWGHPAPVLCPSEWRKTSAKEIRNLFGDNLTDSKGRAALIRDLGEVMLNHDDMKSIHEVYEWCGGDVLTLMDWLKQFKAYRDPVEKKAIFLLATLSHSMGIWKLKGELGTPVDYHETRGHLRLGTVYVEDDILRNKLIHKTPVVDEEDIAIRSTIRQAIELIAEKAQLSPSHVHDFFWNIFRNICKREDPSCYGFKQTQTTLPGRFLPLTVSDKGPGVWYKCPFSEICPSKGTDELMLEHNCQTDLY